MILNEIYDIQHGTVNTKRGPVKIAYINNATSENTYAIKDKLKNEFGAYWFKNLSAWGWYLNDNPKEIYDQKIKPCLKYLTSIETTSDGKKRDYIKVVEELLAKLESNDINTSVSVHHSSMNKDELKNKLSEFKQRLIRTVSSDEFKELLSPILKFKRAQGHQFSIANSILVWIQDPKATMVKSRSNWEKVNRTVKDNAPAITLWVPIPSKTFNKKEKELIKKRFLNSYNVQDESQLSIKQREELRIALKGMGATQFNLAPAFFDYRFTEQMNGKEDLVGDPNADVPWYDDSSEETPETRKLVNAMCEVITDSGVKLDYVDDLGGARGVSMSGTIQVLRNVPKNIGLMNTLVHEFSHELLHQKYLKNNNPELSDYFVGTQEGRGKVEQQAELSAWIVLNYYGYDLKTNINYVGIWGLNENNAAFVFDSVTRVAERIAKDIDARLNMIKESKLYESSRLPNGYELAKMLGCGEIYKRSKMNANKSNPIEVTESEINGLVKEALIRILNKKGLI